MAPQELTDYERRRLENIKRNGEMMASLNVHTRLHDLSAATKPQRVRSQTKSRKLSSENKTPICVRRSIRAQGMPPDSSTAAGVKDGLFKNLRRIRKSHTSRRRLPRAQGPLSMKDLYYSSSGSDKTLVETIRGISKKSQFCHKNGNLSGLVKGIGGGFRNLIVDVTENEGSACPARVWGSINQESFKMKPKNVSLVVPDKVMVLRFLPSRDVKLIIAGDSSGSVGFWNVDAEEKDEDGTYLYQPLSGYTSGISILPFSISKIYTSSFDGFIRLIDLEKEVFGLVYSSDYAILSISQWTSDVRSIYFSEGHGGLNIWDEREGKSSTSLILPEDRINSIDFNANNTNIMATSSTDGTACIWDLRKIDAQKPKPLKMVGHKKVVNSAYFSPSGSSLVTTSTDNIGLLSGTNYEDVSMICHRNQISTSTNSVCRAIWGWDDSYIFVGAMERGLDMISAGQKRTIMTMCSPEMSSYSYCFDVHPYKVGMLAGGSTKGGVYMWT